jgi:alpha-D-ribose 1-methylphosphonate 5-triphosphate synthase subunit PhnH
MTTLAPQLTDDAAYASQRAFRALADGFARPGETRTIPGTDAPRPLAPAMASLLLCLADFETPIWLDPALAQTSVIEWVRFRTGAPIVDTPNSAAFALVGNSRDLPDFAVFAQGSDEYPDRSTTVIIQVDRFEGRPIVIAGPGIKGTRTFSAEPLPEDFPARLTANRELNPRGIDLILIAGTQVQALPRSVRVMTGN